MEKKQAKSAKEKVSKETARAPEKLAGKAHTARTSTGTAQKGSGPVAAGEGDNTAKPPLQNKGATTTQNSKSNASGKEKTTDTPQGEVADRPSSLTANDMNERLTRLEKLFKKVVTDQQGQRALAHVHGTDFSTQYHSQYAT